MSKFSKSQLNAISRKKTERENVFAWDELERIGFLEMFKNQTEKTARQFLTFEVPKILKTYAITALKSRYGFAPKTAEIFITRIRSRTDFDFSVCNVAYSFASYICDFDTVFCGADEVTRCGGAK